jgi:hypothetical protein
VEEFSRLKSDRDERLEQLEGCLTELPQIGLNYARYLRDIELQQTTIETNAKNYSGWLKQLGDYSVQEMDNLDFLQNFVDWSCPKLQDQIKVYMSYLTVGRQLFQQMIETIRGIVEVDAQKQQIKYEKVEKERDRNLQITIAVVGVGIGVAGVVSSSYTLAVDKPWASPSFQHPLPLHPFFSAIIISCLCGGVLGGLAFLTARKVLKSSFDRQSVSGSQNQRVNHVLQEAEEVRSTRDT